MLGYERTYVRIDLDAITNNVAQAAKRTGGKLLCVLKADGYGHGAVPLARHLQDQCAFFGVACMEEAMELRQAGIENPILLLGYTSPREYGLAVRHGLRVAVFREADAALLNEEALRQGKRAYVHLALDTGMSRIGFQCSEAEACLRIGRMPGLVTEGLLSHFATADEKDLSRAKEQEARFRAFDRELRQGGLAIPIRHMNNSAGIMNFGGTFEMSRCGIATYGLYPSGDVDTRLLKLRPALSWLSSVSHVKQLPAGREISYGGSFRTERDMVVATVPVGYADGYPRRLSGRFYVLIRGRRAPILGRVCMDQLIVDVSDIPGVEMEEPVTLVGRDGDQEITIEQIAEAAGTFNYEFVCGIARRVPRVYLASGKKLERWDYLLPPDRRSLSE